MIDPLEPRRLLSGNVAVKISDGHVRFIGDAGSNTLVITYSRPEHQLIVAGRSGTTVDGKSSRVYAARDSIAVSLGAGDDVVTLQRFSGGFNVGVDLGDGNDAVYFKRSNLLAADFFGDTGNDTLVMLDSTVDGNIRFAGGVGADTLWLKNASVRGSVKMAGGAGLDRVFADRVSIGRDFVFEDLNGRSALDLNTLSVRGRTIVQTGNSIDRLTITDSTFAHDAKVILRGGDDRVTVRGSVFNTPSPFNPGTGNNRVDRELMLSWNFADGKQGWDGGFANFSPSKVNPEDDGVSQFEFVNGIAPLPTELGLNQTGYGFSAKNLSDDLFAFLTRPVTAADGIIGGQSYDITFGIRFASNTPAGLIGAGGPPAEAVRLGVGGVAQRPKTYLDEHGDIVINLNKRGVDMSDAGDIQNGEVFGPEDSLINSEKTKYKLVGRTKTHDNPVRSHKTGRLWLIFATKSGFEGRTTLDYASISVRMTPSTSEKD